MCFAETIDSLRPAEQTLLQNHGSDHLPGYHAALRHNAEMTWAVLVPQQLDAMPRFTICRIDPGILVMMEDHEGRRQFAGVASVEDAISFACQQVWAATHAPCNVHPAPELAQ